MFRGEFPYDLLPFSLGLVQIRLTRERFRESHQAKLLSHVPCSLSKFVWSSITTLRRGSRREISRDMIMIIKNAKTPVLAPVR